jgi:predicted amidohydrolase YtcJ
MKRVLLCSDSYGHIFHYGSTRQLVLEGTASLEETVKLVRDFVLNNPELHSDKNSFIFGSGWDHMSWSNTEWPSAVLQTKPTLLKTIADCNRSGRI